jgi:glutathione S-transferase
MALSLYYCPQTRCRTALWMLEEVGADYDLVDVNIRDDIAREAYAEVNPMRKVPALRVGNEVVTETAAVCAFLADAYPEAGLAPAIGAPGRASYLRWLFFGSAAIEPACFEHATGKTSPGASVGWGDWERVLATLHAGLDGQDYLVNNTFSAADVTIGATVGFLTQFKMMEPDPVFAAYLERIMSRPAYQRANAIDSEKAGAA